MAYEDLLFLLTFAISNQPELYPQKQKNSDPALVFSQSDKVVNGRCIHFPQADAFVLFAKQEQ